MEILQSNVSSDWGDWWILDDILPTTQESIVVPPRKMVAPLSEWVGRPWSLAVLGACVLLGLANLYALVFLLLRACEGRCPRWWLSCAQLLSLFWLMFASAVFAWKPSNLVCGLRTMLPGIGLSFCYGCLLIKGMQLRAQRSLGLGGSIDKGNQILTLVLMVSAQVALETQHWRPSLGEAGECAQDNHFIHGFITLQLIATAILAIATRRLPYLDRAEQRSLVATTATCVLAFICWQVARRLLPDEKVAAPAALLTTALAALAGDLGPRLFGTKRRAPLSYAESLSTVFSVFSKDDGSSLSRGRKCAKTPFAEDNPLYADFRAAYP